MRFGMSKAVVLSLMSLGLPLMATQGNTVILAIRGAESVAQQAMVGCSHCVLGGIKAREFANGNTFVQITETVTALDVQVVLPEVIDANSLMELLFTVFTARHLRANNISVFDPYNRESLTIKHGNEQITLDLLKLIGLAGGNSYQSAARGEIVDIKRPPRAFPKPLNASTAVILGDDHPRLRDNLAAELKINALANSSLLENVKNLSGMLVYYVHSSAQPVNWHFFKMLAEVQQLSEQGANVVLITSYLPYARSDKADLPGVAVTGRQIAEQIEGHGADSIAFVRAHAPQSEGFFSIPTFHAHGRATINKFLANLKIDAVVGPDNGSGKEIALHAKELGVSAAVINKARNPETQEIEIVGISSETDLTGKIVAIIDDETASGKTLAEAADYLKRSGVKEVYVVVTSLTGLAKAAIEDPLISQVTITDNVPLPLSLPSSVNVLTVAEELARKLKPLQEAVERVAKSSCQSSLQ